MQHCLKFALVAALATACRTTDTEEIRWVDWGSNPLENPAFMERWGELAQPGEPHAMFAEMAGTYDIDGQMWMAPDAPPTPMTAVSEMHTSLGGRLLIEDFESEFMGTPFHGMLVMGYDNLAGEYYTTWYDDMSTWPLTMRGVADEEGNMRLSGNARDLSTPTGRPMRMVSSHNPDGSVTMRMYDSTPAESEFLAMEMTYRRRN